MAKTSNKIAQRLYKNSMKMVQEMRKQIQALVQNQPKNTTIFYEGEFNELMSKL